MCRMAGSWVTALQWGLLRGVSWTAARLGPRGLYLCRALAWMLVAVTVVYHPYAPDSLFGRALVSYLQFTAQTSAATLVLLGENVVVEGTRVLGRFPYVVVLDCAALDATTLYVSAVLAFPTTWARRLWGAMAGVCCIFAMNVARLALLYFVGVRSAELFHVLHEEVLVFVIIALVCLLFLGWTRLVSDTSATPAQMGGSRPSP